MFVDSEKRVSSTKLIGVSHDIKEVFSEIKDEFEDHLIAINENTNEIQSFYQYLVEIDSKIEKLGQRIDQIQLFLQKTSDFSLEEAPRYSIKPLTKKEQEIFLLLYTAENNGAVDYSYIAHITGITEELVCCYVTSLIEKGVPVLKRCINGRVYPYLKQGFKELQTKENIVGIEQKTFRNF